MAKATGKPPRMPKKEMLSWVRSRSSWDHQDWLALLDDLRDQGFAYWTDSDEGRTALGEYLEANRKK